MKRKQLLKLILVVSLASMLAIVVPSLTGCLGRPAVAPPEAPPEVAPAEEAPPVTQVSAAIKMEVTSSTWREGEEPYDIYSAVREKLERVGFEVVPEESDAYDATLFIDYEEAEGGEYTGGGHGTRIKCNLKLRDKTDNLLFEKEISASTSFMVRGLSLYGDAVSNFKSELYFKYLGEIIATKFGVGDEVSVLLSVLKDEDEDERVREAAAGVLGEIGDERAVEPLIQILMDKDSGVRSAAARALGEIGDERAVETLIQVLKEKNKYLQNTAAEALGEIGDKRAIEPLTNALEDEEEYVRDAAREALEQIQASAPTPSEEPSAEANIVVVSSNTYIYETLLAIDGETRTLVTVAELRNDSTCDVELDEVHIRFYDDEGNTVGSRYTRAYHKFLSPGETTVIDEDVPSLFYKENETNDFPEGWVSYEIIPEASCYEPSESIQIPVDVTVQGVEIAQTNSGGLMITGSVLNTGSEVAADVTAYAILYDRVGNILNASYDSHGSVNLPLGQSITFEIKFLRYELIDYDHYVVDASAESSWH